MLDELPDGIHSGMRRAGTRGAFFYFRADGDQPRHFWRFVDLRDDRIVDNRHVIANLIACSRDTPRHVDPDLWDQVFDLQEQVIEDVLASVQQQFALERTAPRLETVQKNAANLLAHYLNHPDHDRPHLLQLVRFLNQPLVKADLRTLRKALNRTRKAGDPGPLLEEVERLREEAGGGSGAEPGEEAGGNAQAAQPVLRREDLRLVCFELLTEG